MLLGEEWRGKLRWLACDWEAYVAFSVTLYRMVIFFLILAVGFVAGKKGVFTRESLPQFAQVITKIMLPVLIFQMTYSSASAEALAGGLPVLVFSVAFYALLAAVLFALAKLMRLPGDRDKVFTFCFLFGNTGFVGIPLLAALYPETGMLYMAIFTIVDQAIFWTFGIWLATARNRQTAKFSPRSLVTPNTVALALALLMAVLEVPLPNVVSDTLGTIANATSAMCMMYLGAMLCFSEWAQALKCKELYVGIGVKMLVIPVIIGHVLMLFGLPEDMMVSLVLIASLPVMTVVPMIAKAHGDEGDYAAGVTVVTLVVAVASIPLVQLLAFL